MRRLGRFVVVVTRFTFSHLALKPRTLVTNLTVKHQKVSGQSVTILLFVVTVWITQFSGPVQYHQQYY